MHNTGAINTVCNIEHLLLYAVMSPCGNIGGGGLGACEITLGLLKETLSIHPRLYVHLTYFSHAIYL